MAFGSISDMWNKWNIRAFIVFSLLLQVFLILCAPLRKKIANPHIVFLLWLAYLMADSVAISGIGLISHSQGNLSTCRAEVDGAVRAFWVSFLLLHLGGPDTITAFSLEDNLLWRRHLLNFIFQVSVTIYVFVQIFPNDKSLVIPTMLVFLSGFIKNVERILALNFSSLPRLKESMLWTANLRLDAYSKLAEELKDPRYVHSDEEEAKIVESIVVKHAYYFFQIFKTFAVDLFYMNKERLISRKYFYEISAVDALRVISTELNFIYEMLHTKSLTIHSKWSYFFRFIAFIDVAMAFILFNHFKKHHLPKLDVEITYILLSGAIALDVITLFMLVFSDWTIARIVHYKRGSSKLDSFLHKLISTMDDLRKPRFAVCEPEPDYAILDTPFIFRRWSESIFACNLFFALCRARSRKAYLFIRKLPVINCFYQIANERKLSILSMIPSSKNPLIKELWIFIFKEVRRKSKDAFNPTKVKTIFEARGDLFLQDISGEINCSHLLEHVTKTTYDNNVITWHVATEIWYHKEKPIERNDERKFSKILSDYLMYLLVNPPNVLSVVEGIAPLKLGSMLFKWDANAKDVEELCNMFYEDHGIPSLSPTSPLYQGIVLAQKMGSLGERKWEVMSGVWVEMLSYAAGHIKGEAHVQVLSKGGELLVFVWLLMAHFGCLYKPEWGMYEEYMFGTESKTELDDDNGNQEENVSTVNIELV